MRAKIIFSFFLFGLAGVAALILCLSQRSSPVTAAPEQEVHAADVEPEAAAAPDSAVSLAPVESVAVPGVATQAPVDERPAIQPASTVSQSPAEPAADSVTGAETSKEAEKVSPQVRATYQMYAAHASLREPAIADPDSVENQRILQLMITNALKRKAAEAPVSLSR